jgi:hypothetical protein
MKVKRKSAFLIGLVVFLICGSLPATSSGLEVTVFGEAAWTDSDVVVYLYATTEATIPSPLCSFGVKLTYPGDLTLDTDPSATGTDKSTWYLGAESYTDVYEETGAVVLIGGKLDIDTPDEGVEGTRVLLGTVRFTHSGATMPPSFGLTYGKGGSYKNFVCTNSTVLDDPLAPDPPTGDILFQGITLIRERGDANFDGVITNLDMFAIRTILSEGGEYNVVADCNADGVITNLDMFCVRGKL